MVDEFGEALIGATVAVEGTKTATVTDIDGNFSIRAPRNGKLWDFLYRI